jgi:hypothetical protein
VDAAQTPQEPLVPGAEETTIKAQILSLVEYNALITSYADKEVPTASREDMAHTIRRLLVTLSVANENATKINAQRRQVLTACAQLLKAGTAPCRAMVPNIGLAMVWGFRSRMKPTHREGQLSVKVEQDIMEATWLEPGAGIITNPGTILPQMRDPE